MRLFLAMILLAFGTIASHAQYVSGEGHSYTLSCNSDGMVLSSTNPVSRFTGTGATANIEKLDPEKLYLGKTCDAFHKLLGYGKWCWANGGFVAEYDTVRIGFPRQELYCPNGLYDDGRCGC